MVRRKKFLDRRLIVTTPNPPRRKSPVIDDISNDQLIKRLKVIQGLITNNINVGRDNKKSFDALNDRLRKVEIKLVFRVCIYFN